MPINFAVLENRNRFNKFTSMFKNKYYFNRFNLKKKVFREC